MSNLKTAPTILVSGAGGFLGKELVKQLLESGIFNVVAITSKKDVLIDKFKNYHRLRVVDTDNWVGEISFNSQIDTLINCAFPRTSNPEQLAQGLLFTESLIRDSIKLNIKKMINISSQSVYSQKAKSSADENTSVIPESLYGLTKYASERIVATLCETASYKISYSNIRLASLTGIDFEVRMTNRFVKRVLEGQPIIINGGNQQVSYLDVRDAASALTTMLNSDSSRWNKVYNLGNNQHLTVLELAKMVREIAKEYFVGNASLEIKEGQSNFNNLIDSDSFYNDFKWKPYYTIELMVRELFEYYTLRV